MSKTFGLPYMGSKSQIAEIIISLLPSADTFVDLFAGGCAMTHAAILSGKYKRIICNDITDSALVFRDAISGKFADEKRWISREEFSELKDTDPYVRICWSFGNNQKCYLYSKDIEPYKKAFHYAVVFKDVSLFAELGIRIPQNVIKSDNQLTRRLNLKQYLVWYKKNKHAGDLESLERLERLQSLESLERLQSLEALRGDYRDVVIPENSVIYCDPPYRGTASYLNSFDFDAFDDFCRNMTQPTFISEYSMPADFEVYAAMPKRSLLASNGSQQLKIEKVFRPRVKNTNINTVKDKRL